MRKILLSALLLSSSVAMAEPFTDCPTKAFLIQDTIARTYGVNLATGEFGILQLDMGTRSKINGVGFNFHDNYIYGWDYANGVPGKIDKDFQITPLDVKNITDQNFYVGDVAIKDNTYYVYRRGNSYGLYAISLDENNPNYNQMIKVKNSHNMDLRIFDLAFHPTDGFAYSVNNNGKLFQIDVENGTAKQLADTGESGTFGAVYFDVDGNLYFSRNNDGNVFRVSIDNKQYSAELFASGPSSQSNDGARCAMAPIDDNTNTNIDFGDAPDSYGTLMVDNGARHGLGDGATLYLGKSVDGESDGTSYPLSDDSIDKNDDEDGIQFATRVAAGDTSIVLVTASSSGYLQGWIDTNQNGTFESSEQIIKNESISSGTQSVYFDLPSGLPSGSTWSRFRISSSTDLEPTGGAPDGEVEDYQVDVISTGASITHYPSGSGWTTIAFEDNWPYEGDYDMNDMVIYLRTSMSKTDNKTDLISVSGELAAVGAAYHNGFAIRLPGIKRSQINEAGIQFNINELPVTERVLLEQDSDEAILIVSNDVWNYVTSGEGCYYYRTEKGCGSHIQMTFNMTVPFKESIATDISGAFDPFMFASPGRWHGNHFDTPPGRSYEIHLKNQSPTEKFDPKHLTFDADDASVPGSGLYYQTKNGLPWALEIGTRWQYPVEYRDLNHAYPKFEKYVTSDGAENQAWYTFKNAVESILFNN